MLNRLVQEVGLAFGLIFAASATTQALENFEWSHYGADLASTKFAPLKGLHRANFDSLRIIWRWPAAEEGLEDVEADRYRSTPIVVDGVLYTVSPMNLVSALDAETGTQLWTFDPRAWKEGGFFLGFARGVAHWSDGERARIVFGTSSGYLYALDAQTGQPDPAFGHGGRIDLTQGLGRPVERGYYAFVSPPVICRDVVVVGSSMMDWRLGRDRPSLMAPGDVRGFDVRTGALLWTFHAIPRPGEFGADTWPPGARQRHGGTNVWTMMSADRELGYVYLPFSTPDNDFYGGERRGDNLFGESLVCLNVETGERIWHFQIVHHGLWDYDLPAAPILFDLEIDGRPVKAVAQVTKHGFCFVFDRITGAPVWPIDERPVPQSKVPGEYTSPTQPFPTRPAAFERQGLVEDDLIDFTPQLRAEALKRVSRYDYGPLFTPPSERGAVVIPGALGGADWVGAAFDAGRGLLYVPSKTRPRWARVAPPEGTRATGLYRYMGRIPNLRGPRGLPLTKPPYGRITAIDLRSGDHAWMRPTGRGPVDHPDIAHLGLDELGWNVRHFAIATPNLLLVTSQRPEGGGDYWIEPERFLTAYDPDDGGLLGRVPLPEHASGGHMTYAAGGRQYVVVPVGRGERAELVALAVPRPGEGLPPQLVERRDAEHPRFYEAVDLFDQGDVEGLQRLLAEEGRPLVRARGFLDPVYRDGYFQGASLIHLAAANPIRLRPSRQHLAVTRILLAAGADPQALNLDGNRVLDLIITGTQLRRQGLQLETLRLVLDGGAQLGDRILEQAFASGDSAMIALFSKEGFDLDLRFAAGLGDMAALRGFFDSRGGLRAGAVAGADPQTALDQALGYAAFWGRLDAVQFLVGQGAGVNSMAAGFYYSDEPGSTPLHKAADRDRWAVVRWLLDRGADPTARDLNYESTPATWARYGRGSEEMVEFLRAAEEAWPQPQ